MKSKFINKHLFNLQRKSTLNLLIIFSAIVSVLMLVVLAVYPLTEQIIANMPDELKGLVNMSSIADYFNTEAFEIWVLLVSIFVAVMAISITTKEFKNGSYELIYTLNMSRNEIIRTKLLRLILNTIYINMLIFIVSLIGMLIFGVGQFSIVNLLIYAFVAIFVTLQIAILIFSLGLFNKSSFNTFGGIVIVILMFLFTTLSASIEKLEWLGYLSPLTTMNGSIMTNGFKGLANNGIILGIWTLISLIMLAFSIKKFKNDDLY